MMFRDEHDTVEESITPSQRSKLQYLFGSRYREWKMAPEYLMYATPHIISDKIVQLANEQFLLAQMVVWDMFAGIGTDALKFSSRAGKVVCTEINPVTFQHLTENIGHFKTKNNIETYNIDCCHFPGADSVNLAYFDPPWGSSFKSGCAFDFSDVVLDNGKNVMELASEVHQRYPMIIKSPALCDTFEEAFRDDIIRVHTFPQQKLKFIFVLMRSS
jgi:predicted RNA methylase